MTKFGLVPSLTAISFVVLSGICVLSAHGRQQYNNAFKEKYIDPSSKDPEKKQLAAAFATAKCNTCHVGKKDKKTRNDYGNALGKILGKNEKAKDKIAAALDEVSSIKIDENDAASKTYGDRIKEGLLPNP
ncbi:MAG: hypothetical protein IT427_16690 [Pirellulales bacterium]|nr:hypothetical protein [Pirellulales bacterium]